MPAIVTRSVTLACTPDAAWEKVQTSALLLHVAAPLIHCRDHWITIAPGAADGTTHYTDRVEIEAGLLTPLIAGFARVFYAHRQRRWRALAATGFAALSA
jgi:hypothetical protein